VLVLVNLILNAFAAMPDGGTLSIRGELCSNAEIVLSVTDAGTGFEPEALDRTSHPSSTPQSVSTGRGLGLAICTDIMQAGGGRLELRSEAGRGTTASLVFPLDTARGE
jgi:two-component system NtrC family sensor kinase